MNKPYILVNVCCAPCLTVVLEVLKIDFIPVLYFYNPNIYPYSEYLKRLETFKNFVNNFEFKYLIGEYEYQEWLNFIETNVTNYSEEKEGGKRCIKCYEFRLNKTALKTLELNLEIFTTTLTVGPYKPAKLINPIGEIIAKQFNLQFLSKDFKKNNGFKRSVELSKQYNLYRQNYCGCIFSIRK